MEKYLCVDRLLFNYLLKNICGVVSDSTVQFYQEDWGRARYQSYGPDHICNQIFMLLN